MGAKQQLAERTPGERQALALEGFFNIMRLWAVENEDARSILGSPAVRTFYAWKRKPPTKLPEDTLRRIGYVAGIWKALQIVYSDAKLADTWVSRPNDFFGGQTPLQRMAAGDVTDLAAVRAYIDAARAPWSSPSPAPTPTGSTRRSGEVSPSTSASPTPRCRQARRCRSSTCPGTCGS